MKEIFGFVLLILFVYLLEHPEAGGRWFGAFIRAVGVG